MSDAGVAAGEETTAKAAISLFDVLELEVLSLWILSWNVSVAMSNFRASCRTAARLAVRHGPVATNEVIYFEALERPIIPERVCLQEDASQKRNPYSPLRSWSLPLTQSYELLEDYASVFWPTLERRLRRLFRDRSFVLAAVTRHERAFEVADVRFRSDRGVVLAAVTSYGHALRFAHEGFRSDRDVVLAATQNFWAFNALKLADARFRSDREIVLAAVTHDGCALWLADDHFRSDRDVVLKAVQQNGSVLRFVATRASEATATSSWRRSRKMARRSNSPTNAAEATGRSS